MGKGPKWQVSGSRRDAEHKVETLNESEPRNDFISCVFEI